MRVASFDIGKKNFAFCVESFDESNISGTRLPKSKRYNADGTPTPEMNRILGDVYDQGVIEVIENQDISENCHLTRFDMNILRNMIRCLNAYQEVWKTCQVVLVEQQMTFGRKMNVVAIKIGMACIAYFLTRFPHIQVIEYPSYHKTQVLGAPKGMTKLERKKWATDEAAAILLQRGDMDTYAFIQTSKKKDDMSDVIVQLQSFKYLHLIDGEF